MTREEISRLALSKIDKCKYLILELATGCGKTKIAIDLVNHICDRVYNRDKMSTTILILVSKTVHKQTWRDEIKKWGGIKSDSITIECYDSLKKYKDRTFDVIIADEAQHLSENRLNTLSTLHINEAFIGLSATIKRSMRDLFTIYYKASIIKCDIKEAIADEVLPEPTVYLLPIELDNTKLKYKLNLFGRETTLTQKGYYNKMSDKIEWYKNKYMNTRNERLKTLWLSEAGKRLKWCSEQKESIVLELLNKFKRFRTLTFCNNIDQSKRLGEHNINSKNKDSVKNFDMFNDGLIDHITSVNILNESVNLLNCRIGIFCNLNSSEIITKQRCGRLLRHKSPVIIIPYLKGTREEELVIKMMLDFNEDYIIEVNNINDIKL